MENGEALGKVCVRDCGTYHPCSQMRIHQGSSSFFAEAVLWKRLSHPNIAPFTGITTDHLQVVSEGMPKGTPTEYLEENSEVNRIGLVSSFSFPLVLPTMVTLSPPQVTRYS